MNSNLRQEKLRMLYDIETVFQSIKANTKAVAKMDLSHEFSGSISVQKLHQELILVFTR